jgi:hypothetical protein
MTQTLVLLSVFITYILAVNPNVDYKTVWGRCVDFVVHGESGVSFAGILLSLFLP